MEKELGSERKSGRVKGGQESLANAPALSYCLV